MFPSSLTGLIDSDAENAAWTSTHSVAHLPIVTCTKKKFYTLTFKFYTVISGCSVTISAQLSMGND